MFDDAGRLLRREYRDLASHGVRDADEFNWDLTGKLTAAISGRYNTRKDFQYDDAARLTRETSTIGIDNSFYVLEHQCE